VSKKRRDNTSVVEASAVVGGGLLLAGSWAIVAATKEVPRSEARIFARVNELPNSAWPVVWLPMQAGSLVGSLALCGLLATRDRHRRVALVGAVASQAAYWGSKGVKRLASRGRPAVLLVEVRERERATGLGYVSGHSAVAFALATVVAPSVPAWGRVAAFTIASLVGFGRMYSGAHLPLDVVGGIGLGVVGGTGARWLLGLGGAGLPPRR
jgi:undecaprenyl-diphosphatase